MDEEKINGILQKLKNSKSTRYRIFIVVFVLLLVIFLSSKLFMPSTETIVATEIGTTKKIANNISITLKSWKYNPDNHISETTFVVDSGKSYSQNFDVSAVNEKGKKYQVDIVYRSTELLIVDTKNVPTSFEGLKVIIRTTDDEDASSEQQNNLFSDSQKADFVATCNSVEEDKTISEDKSNTYLYDIQNIQNQIDEANAAIKKLENDNETKQKEIDKLNEDIKLIGERLSYQTEEEKRETYSLQAEKEIEIEKLKKEMSSNQLEIESWQRKVTNYEQKISQIEQENQN